MSPDSVKGFPADLASVRRVQVDEDDAVAAIAQEAADNFGWQLYHAAITVEQVEAIPGTSPPLPGVRYDVCWEDQGGPRETVLYRVRSEETGGAMNWYEVPDRNFTSDQLRPLERFVAAKVGPPSPRNADA